MLAARLADAKCFWENDLREAKSGMLKWQITLNNVTFHNKLGSQSERIKRIAALAYKLAHVVGADADIVVWDPNREKTILAANQQSAIDYNVFEGKKVKGLPRFTLTRGKVAIYDGEVRTEEGHGKFIKRDGNTATNKALSSWKALTSPRPVKRTGIPASGV